MYAMSEEPEEKQREEGPPQKKEGQLLGCFFALVGVGFIFLCLFVFLRACA
jgi:hypothetical protein